MAFLLTGLTPPLFYIHSCPPIFMVYINVSLTTLRKLKSHYQTGQRTLDLKSLGSLLLEFECIKLPPRNMAPCLLPHCRDTWRAVAEIHCNFLLATWFKKLCYLFPQALLSNAIGLLSHLLMRISFIMCFTSISTQMLSSMGAHSGFMIATNSQRTF